MFVRLLLLMVCFVTSIGVALADGEGEPIAIGRSYLLDSEVMGEGRRINVYLPRGYDAADAPALPVLYMPDGGMAEDFLHVAGLVQVLVGNWGMRPFLLVGIENTERRRDLTGPTEVASDREIAPRVGGSARFRKFIRDELKPFVARQFRVTPESAIIGESLAGLFVIETLLIEPDLFDTYIAFDPSLWWNGSALLRDAHSLLEGRDLSGKAVFLAASSQSELTAAAHKLADSLTRLKSKGLQVGFRPMPEETHMSIYHPAALVALRTVLKRPEPSP